MQTYHGRTIQQRIAPDILSRLHELSDQHEVTLFMTLLSAFNVLMSRYSGQDDITVGSPIAGRNRQELEELIGFFVNTLVLRSNLSGDPSFVELLQRVRQTTLDAYSYQEIPYEKLVDELRPQRDLSRESLFQVFFGLQNTPLNLSSEPAGLRFEHRPLESSVAQFDLSVLSMETETGLHIGWQYNTDLFEEETIRRMASHFERLLTGIVAQPERRISQYPMLGSSEKRQQLVEWNDTDESYPQSALHHLFEDQVKKSPQSIALAFEDRTLTYEQLNRSANQLARLLKKRGIERESLVGVCLDRSVEMVIALYGILKAGAAYVPIDPGYPVDRQQQMLDDARVTFLLADTATISQLPDYSGESFLVDKQWDELTPLSESNLNVPLDLDNVAYMIYTSGSTGRPKGVKVSHRAICNRLMWMQAAFSLTSEDRVLQKTPFSFDVSVWEFFWPLLWGARLVVARPEGHKDPQYLAEVIQAQQITTLHFVPSMLGAFVETQASVNCSSISRVICSGEALPYELQQRFFERLQQAELHNLYGPTEAAVDVTWWPCQRDDLGGIVPIGRPIDNITTYILDRNFEPMPVGVPGELYLGGVGLARGYHRRPGLTAEKFVPHPHSEQPGARLYRTGDLCRWLPSGDIEFLGRIDHQVKIRGFRIELGEIEAALHDHPAIQECVVTARDDSNGRKRLVAHCVSDDRQPFNESLLRNALKDRLPDYMVPTMFVRLDELPLSPNGKVNRKLLPEPDSSRPRLATRFAPPRNEEERLLVDIWRDVLGIDQVGVLDNFFELGGDSIQSIQVVSRANQVGLGILPRHVFQYQTIAELAEVADEVCIIAEQRSVSGDVELTPVQRSFFAQDLPETDHYNLATMLRVTLPLDIEVLRRATTHILVHHDALRSQFRHLDDRWTQFIGRPGSVTSDQVIDEIDLRDVLPVDLPQAIEQHASSVQRSMNLENGPLLRIVWIRTNDADRLLLAAHHLVVDGVSLRIILEDLLTCYEMLKSGRDPQLSPKTTSVKAWGERLLKFANDEPTDDFNYWLELADQSLPVLQRDHDLGPNDVASSGSVTNTLDAETTRSLLQEVPRFYRTQINDVLLTALSRAVQRWSGESSVWIDLEGHGREPLFDDMDLSRTVGWFTTIYPVQLIADSKSDPGTALRAIKEQLRQIPQRGIGYGLLAFLRDEEESSASEGSPILDALARQKLRELKPEIVFNYLGQTDQLLPDGLSLARDSIGALHGSLQQRAHVFDVNAIVANGKLEISWTFSRNLHQEETIRRLSAMLVEELSLIVDHCVSLDQPCYTPSDFPLIELKQEELDQIVSAGSEVEDIYPISAPQTGILFHSLYAPESTRYYQCVSCVLGGELDLDVFQRAWQTVIERHAILRTRFVWYGVPEPLQVVDYEARMDCRIEDIRQMSAEEQDEYVRQYGDEDKLTPLDLAQCPLMRLSLLQLADDRWQVFWGFHHSIMDGWSIPLVLKEVMFIYETYLRDMPLPLESAPDYRNYVEWLQTQDFEQAKTYWRKTLKGIEGPTPFGVDQPPSEQGQPSTLSQSKRQVRFSPELTAQLEAFVRQHQLTMNSLAQGIWALLLSHYSGRQEVVFGTTVSGRSVNLPGIESMVGMFINVLPFRVSVDHDQSLSDWLLRLKDDHALLRQFEYTPLVMAQQCSDVQGPLFESILTFENFPVDKALEQQIGGLVVGQPEHFMSTSFPMVLLVAFVPELQVEFKYDRERFKDSVIEEMLETAIAAWKHIAEHPDSSVRELIGRMSEIRQQHQEKAEQEFAEAGLRMLKKRGDRSPRRAKQSQESIVTEQSNNGARPSLPSSNGIKKRRRQAVRISTDSLVTAATLCDESRLPLVVQPSADAFDMTSWATAQRDWIKSKLYQHGAILFRGFGISTAGDFEGLAESICPGLHGDYGDLPRGPSRNIYGSTVYPPEKPILFHNESSHCGSWPLKQFFFCQTASPTGGETPILDCRLALDRLQPDVRERFVSQGLTYVRTFLDGVDVPWQDFFGTNDRSQVEEFCRSHNTQFEWLDDDQLQIRQTAPAVAIHPITNDRVFFNQIQLHHASCLEASVRDSMVSLFGEDRLPRNVYFGDGTPIDDEIVHDISKLYGEISVEFSWQNGDVLMVDNMLTSHGRNSFSGPRKILVALAELFDAKELPAWS